MFKGAVRDGGRGRGICACAGVLRVASPPEAGEEGWGCDLAFLKEGVDGAMSANDSFREGKVGRGGDHLGLLRRDSQAEHLH